MPFTSTIIDGGLDLITAPQAVQPGRLTACNNYEVARQRGIRRMDGYEKYDGGQSPSTGNSILAWTTLQTSNPPFGMQVGDAMHYIVAGFPDQDGTVWFIDSTGLYPVVYVSLFQPLPYDLQQIAANPPAGGFAFYDDTTTSSYNILSAGGGAPSLTLFPPGNLTVNRTLSSSVDPQVSLLLPGTVYGYRVTALNVNGQTTGCPEVTVTTNNAIQATTTGAAYIAGTVLDLVCAVPPSLLVGQSVYCTDGTNTVIGRISLIPPALTFISVDAQTGSGFTIVAGDPASMGALVTVTICDIIELAWDATVVVTDIPPPLTYNLYGRTPSAETLITNIDGTNVGFVVPDYIDYGQAITSTQAPPLANTTGTAGSVIDNLAGNFTAISATVQEVPGRNNVNGIFWLKDRVYATRDYMTINYDTGTNQPNIGDVVYQGASFGAATWVAQVAKLTITSGSFGDSNDAAGSMMFYNETADSLNVAVFKNHTQGDITVATVHLSASTPTAAGLYVAIGDRGLTVATRSWQWCDLGWTVQYKSGQNDFIDMNLALSLGGATAQYVTTGWKVAGTSVGGGGTWNTGSNFIVANIAAPSDSLMDYWPYHTGTQNPKSGQVQINNFGFTNADVPATASIIGLEIQMVYGSLGHTGFYTASPIELTFQLQGVSNGPTPNLASSTVYTVKPFAASLGTSVYADYTFATKFWGAPTTVANTPTSLLGYTGINPADITASTFGINMQWGLSGTQTNQEIRMALDYIAVRVTYLPQTNGIYFWNVGATSPTAVRAQVVMHYEQGGDLSGGTATGTVYFQFIQSNGTVGGPPVRPIGSDEQIRTWPANGNTPDGGMADGSTLLALTSTAADMNTMDWTVLLQGSPQPDGTMSPPSKYQSVTKNFYASSGLDAIYGVSGGGPGFYYDGIKFDSSGNIIPGNFSRILTGLPLQFETPRSVEAHQAHIFFGYFSGVIEWSNAENTLSFDPALYDGTAGTNGFGERVIGIKSINGDSLCVWTQSTIQMMQGNFNVPPGSIVTSSLYTTTISPTSGGIEYTIQPMANYMYCDFRGITAIGATQKYGDFELGHYSAVVAPWIIPRVQLSSFFEGPATGIINSVLIRNKNMARYFFADGAALSMTFLEDNEPPQFTIQNYQSGTGTALTWDVIQAFTERLGRDRIFGATATTDGSGFVYELERANSFNDFAITATASLVPDTAQVAYQNKEFKGIVCYGQAQDYASFTLSRSSDYTVPQQATGNNVIDEVFGALTASPTGNVLPFATVGSADLSIEGTSICLRFDSSSREQFPHLIQAVSYTVDPLQDLEG